MLLTLGVIFAVTWASVESGTRWIGDAANPALLVHLGALPGDDFPARLSRMARPQSRGDGAGRARMRRAHWAAHVGLRPAIATVIRGMKLLITGLNHRTAPVEVREKLWRLKTRRLPEALGSLKRRPGLLEGMILSTCNRVEIAVTADEEADAEECGRSISGRVASVERAWVSPYLYRHDGPDAIRHLFRVASSLDSMIVGEPQILGQLKAAYALAKERGAVSGFLDLVLTRAFNVAKRVRSETDIGPERGFGELRRGGAGARNFRIADGQARAAGGRGQDGGIRRAAPAARGRLRNPGDQPDANARRSAGRGISGPRDRLRTVSRRRCRKSIS